MEDWRNCRTSPSFSFSFSDAFSRQFGAGLDGEGPWGRALALLLSGHLFRHAFGFRFRQLQDLKQFLHQRFFLRDVAGFGDVLRFFMQALEVGAGDLQGVEHEGGALGVHGLVGEEAHHLEERVLQAHGVLDHPESAVGLLGVGGVVEDAIVASAAGRGGAGRAVQFGVLAAGSEVGVSSAIGVHVYPSGGCA